MPTLAEVVARFDDVDTTPDGYLVHCPAHTDSHQSLRLSVSADGKVLMKCRAGCETKAVLKALGLTMRDLASMKPGDVDLSKLAVSKDVPASAAEVAALAVKLDGYSAALSAARLSHDSVVGAAFDYAEQRFGLDGDACERLGLGFADDLGGGPRLVVPFRDKDGIARGFQARALQKDAAVRWLGPKSPDGATWAKVGYFPGGSGWDEVLICEGPGDALTGAALGYDTIGIRGAGLASNPAVIDDVAAMLGDREAVVAGDGDPSGRRFSAKLAEALTARGIRVRILNVPDGLDLTDWRGEAGASFSRDVIRAIAEATPVKSRNAALLVWDEERYSLTDLGGARYLRDFIESVGSGVRYSEELGFYLLESGVWRKDDRQQVRTHAQSVADLVRNLAREATLAVSKGDEDEAVSTRDKKRAARLNRYAAHVQTSRGIDAMIRELQAVDGVPARPEDFDRHPDLLACRNGVIDLRTGQLRPHDPALLLTRRVELDFDPAAKAPRWEAFLDEVFPDHDGLPDFMRRMVGYGITGHTTEQCFAVLWGTGANGKSVFTDTLTEVFRELTVTTPFSTFEDRGSGGIPNDIAALKGARLVMAAEGEQGKPMSEAVLKRVTGRDLISARFMRKEFFEFRPTFLLMLATNFKPAFKGQDEGLWRRVKLIPWERYFAPHERDPRLGDKLLAEAQGILAWAVRGAQEWHRGGLDEPEIIRNSTREYRETQDVLYGFLPGVFIADEGGRVEAKQVFADFQNYAEEHNHLDLRKWSSRALYRALDERGYTRRKTNGKYVIDGIRRARQTDAVPDHDAPENAPAPGRAGDGFLAHSKDVNHNPETPALSGADLDSVL